MLSKHSTSELYPSPVFLFFKTGTKLLQSRRGSHALAKILVPRNGEGVEAVGPAAHELLCLDRGSLFKIW